MAQVSGTIARNTAIDSAAQVGSMVFSVLTGIVLANILGAEGRGAYVFATSFAGMLLFGFTNMGLELAASVLVAKDPTRLAKIHTMVFAGCFTLGLAIAAALLTTMETVRQTVLPGIHPLSLLALALALPFWSYQHGCYGILVGLGAIRTRAFFDLSLSLLQNLTVIGILLSGLGEGLETRVLLLVAAFYAIITLAALALMLLLAARHRIWALPDWALAKEFYQYGFWVYAGNLGGNLGQRVDQYFVKQVSGSDAAFGVYTLATSLTARTRIFPQALSRSAYPKICALPREDAAKLVAACFRQMLALGVILLAGGTILSPLIPLIYSDEFAPAVLPFIIFLGGRLFHNCSWMLATFFSGQLARPQIPMAVNWALLPVQGVLAFFAMQIGGLVAVAVITAGSYFLLFATFLVLFLWWQDAVRLRDLLRITAADFAPWKSLLGQIFFKKKAG